MPITNNFLNLKLVFFLIRKQKKPDWVVKIDDKVVSSNQDVVIKVTVLITMLNESA